MVLKHYRPQFQVHECMDQLSFDLGISLTDLEAGLLPQGNRDNLHRFCRSASFNSFFPLLDQVKC